MSTKPRAPLTAHLSKRIRKNAKMRSKVSKKKPSMEANRFFHDDDLYQWCKVTPEYVRTIGDICSPVHHKNGSDKEKEQYVMTGEDQKLCDILEHLVIIFKEQRRYFAAMTAKNASRLVHFGRSNHINPGLWSYIHEAEYRKHET